MNRRSFLSILGLGGAGLALDPEKLLWIPGAKKIFLPPLVNKPVFAGVYAGQMIFEHQIIWTVDEPVRESDGEGLRIYRRAQLRDYIVPIQVYGRTAIRMAS